MPSKNWVLIKLKERCIAPLSVLDEQFEEHGDDIFNGNYIPSGLSMRDYHLYLDELKNTSDGDKYMMWNEREAVNEALQKLFTAVRKSNCLIEYSEFTTDSEMWAIDIDDLRELIKNEFGVEVE